MDKKPIVLVIHGMGTHKPGEMKTQVSAGINETAKLFGLNDFKIEDKVEFFQFNYSDFLDEVRMKDADYANAMASHLKFLQGHGLGEKIVKELTTFFGEFKQDEVLYTHWMDVLYYSLTFWGEKIRVDLAKRLNDILIEANTTSRGVHIIAHSLGTAVLHDTLAKIYRRDAGIYSKIPGLSPDRFPFQSIWTVANVSRLVHMLNDIADPQHSIVHSGQGGCCNYLFNVKNEFDPFTWVKTYDRAMTNGKHITVKTIRSKNTHDIQEYMAAPEVTTNFLYSVLGIGISEPAYTVGKEKHEKTSVNKSYDDLKKAFDQIKTASNPKDKIEALKTYFENAEAFKDEIEKIFKK